MVVVWADGNRTLGERSLYRVKVGVQLYKERALNQGRGYRDKMGKASWKMHLIRLPDV